MDILPLLPALPDGVKRTIYVRCALPEDVDSAVSKGYTVVDLFTLPRDTEQQQLAYLRAKAQALEEGTIPYSAEERKTLELEMKAAGLLGRDAPGQGDGPVALGEAILTILDWGNSSHTLRDNSTVQTAAKRRDQEKKN